ncbi:FixH family protein [Paenibacillus sp. NPDC056579]|uniref:FixH family protein n=1 Tax=unclassified Paenibacillus TaxID=185978 RepID=UPI001EF8C233|nr:FixH family protein [Paenibacillus sp. H1-7]ULL14992.1 hypothetical protein DVH26_11400 [Paenibacillus sp. H1-7]
MKKMFTALVGVVSVVGLLSVAACSNPASIGLEQAEPVQVEVSTVQETLLPGRAILLEAKVTQGNDKVEDAQEVKFEIWKKDQPNHQTVTASHWKDGVYRIKTMFPEDGTYNVIAHVTARDMSVMPQKELVVEKVLGTK